MYKLFPWILWRGKKEQSIILISRNLKPVRKDVVKHLEHDKDYRKPQDKVAGNYRGFCRSSNNDSINANLPQK